MRYLLAILILSFAVPVQAQTRSERQRNEADTQAILREISRGMERNGTAPGRLAAKAKEDAKAARADAKARAYAKNHRSAIVAAKVARRKGVKPLSPKETRAIAAALPWVR